MMAIVLMNPLDVVEVLLAIERDMMIHIGVLDVNVIAVGVPMTLGALTPAMNRTGEGNRHPAIALLYGEDAGNLLVGILITTGVQGEFVMNVNLKPTG